MNEKFSAEERDMYVKIARLCLLGIMWIMSTIAIITLGIILEDVDVLFGFLFPGVVHALFILGENGVF